MTDEKKIEEQAPEQGEEKVEAVVLDENVLEQLLVGCIWDVLRRMHRVATKAITPEPGNRGGRCHCASPRPHAHG